MGKSQLIPIFDISIDADESLGIFGLSLVDAPATMTEMHTFKKEEPIIFSNHEKREIVAPVLITNQLIYRETPDGFSYYMRANAETIKKLYERYMLSGQWSNFTYMHSDMDAPMEDRLLDGVYLQRLWIINDEKNDDAFTKYGFESLPVGTMMMKAKINNRQIWSEIKEGKLRGISLEAFFDKISTNKALQINFSKMKSTLDLFSKFVAFLNEVSVEAEDIAAEAKKDETNSGDIELKYYLDDEHYFVVDGEGFVRDENGEKIEQGSYKLADGNVFTVDESGKFVSTEAIAEADDEDKVEAPIAETFEEKEEDEEDKKDVEEPKGEDGNDGSEPNDEDVPVDGDEVGEVPAEEDDKRVSDDDEKLEEELPVDEEPEEKPLVNALPYEIDGVEYLLPAEVIEYIESLKTSKIEVEEKLTKMSEQTPSASPIGTVVKTANDESDINSRISALSMFKGFRNRN